MSDFIFNTLILHGEASAIAEFREAFVSYDRKGHPRLDLDAIVPMPDDLDLPQGTDYPTLSGTAPWPWLSWRGQNWGPMWNSTSGRWIEMSRTSAALDFLTPGVPPLPVLGALIHHPKFAELTAEFVAFHEAPRAGADVWVGRFCPRQTTVQRYTILRAQPVLDQLMSARLPANLVQRLMRLDEMLSAA